MEEARRPPIVFLCSSVSVGVGGERVGSSVSEIDRTAAPVGRLLLIDDEQRILNFVSRGLRAEGMSVDAASDGEEGLRLALSRSYDLVILDLVMPGMDGETVLRNLLRRKPSQP